MKLFSSLLIAGLWSTSPLWAMEQYEPYIQYLIDTGQVYLAEVVTPSNIQDTNEKMVLDSGNDFSSDLQAKLAAKKTLEKYGLIAEENLFPQNITPPFCFEKLKVKGTPYKLKHTDTLNMTIHNPGFAADLEKDMRESRRTFLYDLYKNKKVIGQLDLTLSDFFKETLEINVTFDPNLNPKNKTDFGVEMSKVLNCLFDALEQKAAINNQKYHHQINFLLMNTPLIEEELIQPALELLSRPRDTFLEGYFEHPSYNDLCVYFKRV